MLLHLLILHEKQLQRVRKRVCGLRATKHDPIKASIWLPGAHSASKYLFVLPDGCFLSLSSEKNRVSLVPQMSFVPREERDQRDEGQTLLNGCAK